MDIYHFLNLFFYFEILVLVSVFVFILVKRVSFFYYYRREDARRNKLSKIISSCLLKKESCELIEIVYTKKLLLEVLETFNHRFTGEEWDLLKNALSEKYLLPVARKWSRKSSWIKRNFAARAFALSPLKEDQHLINFMIDDESFLVSSIASLAAIKLESVSGIKKMLAKMTQTEGYYHYLYADILSQGSSRVFDLIFKICQKKDHLYLACLDVLSRQTAQASLKFLSSDLKSKDLELKTAALKVAVRNPQEQWLDVFCHEISSSDVEIRQLAAQGLANYQNSKSYKALKAGLEDESWQVKIASARGLKILDKLDLIQDKDLKKYVQEFD